MTATAVTFPNRDVRPNDATTTTTGGRNGLSQIDAERLTTPRPSDVNMASRQTQADDLRASPRNVLAELGCGFCRQCSPATQGRIAIASCQARRGQR